MTTNCYDEYWYDEDLYEPDGFYVGEWEVQGLYSTAYGWERLTTHDTREDALDEARIYDENEPGTPHRVKRAKL